MNSFKNPINVSLDGGSNKSSPKSIISDNGITTNRLVVGAIDGGDVKLVVGAALPEGVVCSIDTTSEPKTITITNTDENASYSVISYLNNTQIRKKVVDVEDYSMELFEDCLSISFPGGAATSISIELVEEDVSTFNKIAIHDEVNDTDLVGVYFNLNGEVVASNIKVDTINGIRINSTTPQPNNLGTVPVIPVIKTDSVMEVGKYIDLHDTNATDSDNSVRLQANSNSLVIPNANIVLTQASASSDQTIQFTNNDDHARIRFYNYDSVKEHSALEIATSDDQNEPIYVRQYKYNSNNSWNQVGHELVLLDANGNTTFPGTISSSTISLSPSGGNRTMTALTSANEAAVVLGRSESKDDSAVIWYRHNTTPHSLGFTFYGNANDLMNLDTSGNVSITGNITSPTITNLQSSLDGKADEIHTHAISDVVNLQTELDDKADVSHTHSISDITNLQTSLDGKADSTHTHEMTDINGLSEALENLEVDVDFTPIYTAIDNLKALL